MKVLMKIIKYTECQALGFYILMTHIKKLEEEREKKRILKSILYKLENVN